MVSSGFYWKYSTFYITRYTSKTVNRELHFSIACMYVSSMLDLYHLTKCDLICKIS